MSFWHASGYPRYYKAIGFLQCCSPGNFSQAGYLKMPINSVHNGQKDHKCDSCGKAFPKGPTLILFIMVKNYKCDPCRKSYSQAGHLKTHTNSVHNGQKDDKCDSYLWLKFEDPY